MEGDSRDIVVRYQIAELAEPWTLGISVLPGTASPTDYEIGAESVQIPAGQALAGEVSIPLAALSDGAISEGEETVTAAFVANGSDGPRAEFGEDLEITIIEAGGSPCPGIRALASPVAAYADGIWDAGGAPGSGRTGGLQTTLTTEWNSGSAGVVFDWIAPFAPFAFIPGGATVSITNEESREVYSVFHARIPDWQVETVGGATKHAMQIQWPTDLVAAIRFRSGSCVEEPVVRCDERGCELTP